MKVARSIVETLCYADVFDYSLTIEQLHRRLITPVKISFNQVKNQAEKLVKKGVLSFEKRDYCFKGREEIVKLKYQSAQTAKQKQLKAKKMVMKLKFIPSILLIGLSGNLAMANARKSDDIDLFIICQQNKLWTTRLLAVLLSELAGQRRRPQAKRVTDKICLNMFVDENNLPIPLLERDLFSAYEVIQMRPLFDRGGVYQRFFRQNQWVLKYLANADKDEVGQKRKEPPLTKTVSNDRLEKWLTKLQLSIMAKRKTNEIIKPGYVRFHPHDARKWILKKYRKNLEKFKIRKTLEMVEII